MVSLSLCHFRNGSSTESNHSYDRKPVTSTSDEKHLTYTVTHSVNSTNSVSQPNGTSSYSFDALDTFSPLTKQYHSATNLLQNISARTYFENSLGKYVDNGDSKYVQTGTSEFSNLLTKNSTTTANYSFGQTSMMQSVYTPPQNIIGSKAGLTSQFSQFSSGLQPLTTSAFLPLVTNSYTSAFNLPYYNSKFTATDNITNNNYLYHSNIFNHNGSNKLPPYTASQGATQIFPPYGSNNLFSPGMSNPMLQSQDSGNGNYSDSSMIQNSGSSIPQTPSSESVPVTPIGMAAPSMVATSSVDPLSGLSNIVFLNKV